MKVWFWWLDAEATPVLIPNTEVKLCSADDTRKGKVGSRQNQVFNLKILLLGTPKLSSVVPMILLRGKVGSRQNKVFDTM